MRMCIDVDDGRDDDGDHDDDGDQYVEHDHNEAVTTAH